MKKVGGFTDIFVNGKGDDSKGRFSSVTQRVISLLVGLFLILALGNVDKAVAETVKLVTGNGYPPFADQKLPNGGLATEIIQRAFTEMGYQVNIDFKPWKRGYNDARKKKYLGTFPYGKNEQRQQIFLYSQPLYNFAQHFFVSSETSIKFDKDEDLQGLSACLPIGYNPTRLQKMVDKGIVTLERPVDIDACFQMLVRGRTDLVRVDKYVGWKVIEKIFNSRSGFRMLDKPVRENVEHLIIAKDYPDGEQLLAQFNKTIEALKQRGVIEEIIQMHIK